MPRDSYKGAASIPTPHRRCRVSAAVNEFTQYRMLYTDSNEYGGMEGKLRC